ncbi:hypothetical protein TSUD_327180 [Trifolium subterraneum]|uniref:CCHC-type domain-containing protein n=1 Tax=Trifolium subterraneum TaxID=3900 RepID=A0A2Z6NYQ6_TRISU|nr:hypothetical protein TSUD_327180 [Trifolium subterraneum]
MSDVKLSAKIPHFDGHHYDHWSELIENLLRAKGLWSMIEIGYQEPVETTMLTEEQLELLQDSKTNDHKVKHYLFRAIDRSVFEQLLDRRTSKIVWDSLKRKYGGNDRVKKSMLNSLRREFEVLEMKDAETITEYFARVMTVANKMRSNGEVMSDSKLVQKILRTLTEKFTYVVVSIEESKETEEMTIDELQSSLVVHEQKFKRVNRDNEQALKVESSRGRGSYRGRGRARGRRSFTRDTMECFKCHKLGHLQYECPEWNKETNYAELDDEEELLLMALVEENEAKRNDAWFLHSGCSNHMCGDKGMFLNIVEGQKHSVKCGNNSRMSVAGKGSVRLLQEKDLTIIIKGGKCNIYHQDRGLIAHTNMSANRMFIIFNKSSNITATAEKCLHTSSELTYLWHQRYGHLNYKGLKTLQTKKMVRGLPQLEPSSVTCADYFIGKQHQHLRVWWCIAHVHIPEVKRGKLDDKSFPCIMLGISDESKGYRLFNPKTKRIVVSKDVVFEEEKSWDWGQNFKEQIDADLVWSDDEFSCDESEGEHVVETNDDSGGEEDGSNESRNETEISHENTTQGRERRPPIWMTDYESGDCLSEEEAEFYMVQDVTSNDPTVYEEAVKHEKSRKAMDCEINSIEKNQAWELMDLPGYSQQHRIDFTEVFAAVARMDTVRMIVALAACRGWGIFQLDVKSVFLHGELSEDIYVEQPKGPIVPGFKINRDVNGVAVDDTYFKQIVGSLMYLTATRPDIMFSVSIISRYMSKPTELHLQAAKRILRYVKGTVSYGIFYKKGGEEELLVFTDSDYAGDEEDSKRTSGYVFLLSSGAVSWMSKKQPIVTLSTTEAKFVAAAASACQAVWMIRVLRNLSHVQEGSTVIMCDNSSTIKLSKNAVMHGRSKHIRVCFHFLRDLAKEGEVELVHCASQEHV